jgi:hypothetical protein
MQPEAISRVIQACPIRHAWRFARGEEQEPTSPVSMHMEVARDPEAVSQGALEEFRDLVRSQGDRLQAAVQRRVTDPALAERVAHDSFVELWTAAGWPHGREALSVDRLFAIARARADAALRAGERPAGPVGPCDPVATVTHGRMQAREPRTGPPRQAGLPNPRRAEQGGSGEAPPSAEHGLDRVRMHRPGIPAWARGEPDRPARRIRWLILLVLGALVLAAATAAAFRSDLWTGWVPSGDPEISAPQVSDLPGPEVAPVPDPPVPAEDRPVLPPDLIPPGRPEPRTEIPRSPPDVGEEVRQQALDLDRNQSAGRQVEPTRVMTPPWAIGRRVFIHHTAGGALDTMLAQRVAGYLNREGVPVVDIRPVRMEIRSGSIRYFRADDAPAAREIGDAMGGLFADNPVLAPRRVLDFTHYEPKPRPGTVEIWLPSSEAPLRTR